MSLGPRIDAIETYAAPAYRILAASSGIVSSDKIVEFVCSSGSCVATLPNASSFPVGQLIKIVRAQDFTPANTLSINTTSGQLISGRASGSIKLQPLDYIEVVSDGSAWHAIQLQETVCFIGFLPNASSIGTSNTVMNYSIIQVNTHSCYSSGIFTAPCAGKYDYDAMIVSPTNLTGQWDFMAVKNGVSEFNHFIKAGTAFGNTYQAVTITGTIPLAASETISIVSYANVVLSSSSTCMLSIRKTGN